jgi:DNA processing protein
LSGPFACDECLLRAWLVGALSPAIEGALAGHRGGRVRELLALPRDELAAAVGGEAEADELLRSISVPSMRAEVRRVGCWACCLHDGGYPDRLRQLGDAPAVLFGRGRTDLLAAFSSRLAATVVGARRPSGYGREMAERLGTGLARAGLIVVSGLAIGIDSCAHQGALAAAGSTVAVLGGGPERASPSSTRRLYERIAADGLILSELPPGTTPRRWSFPARNRIMAALAEITVVVEARERSGSLITAGMASDLGREVGAVPGQVGGSSAAGANGLLRDGAQVIRGAEDVLDSLIGAGASIESVRSADSTAEPLDPELEAALERVQLGDSGPDAVARESGLSPDAAAGALVRLELRGLVRSDSAGRYRPAAG